MGIIGKIIGLSVAGAIGYGIGYLTTKSEPELQQCQQVYEAQLQTFEEKYKELSTSGIATPSDLRIEYLAAPEAGFKGYTFTDSQSGRQGVIAKQSVLGIATYSFAYSDLESILNTPTEKIAQR